MEENIVQTETLPLHLFLEFCHSLETYHSLDDLSEAVTTKAMDVFNADRGIFFLNEKGTLIPKNNANYSEGSAIDVADSLVKYYKTQHRHSVVHGRTPMKSQALAVLNEHGAANVLCAPFHAAGKLLGALYLDTTDPGKPFADEAFLLIKTLSAIAAQRISDLHPSALNNGKSNHNGSSSSNGHSKKADAVNTNDEYDLLSIVGRSPRLQSVMVKVSHVASMNVPVLLEGESGTGKDLLARALHVNGDRRDKPFVAINCGAIPEQLLASELFGYERGAFTGASSATQGKFEAASDGTLFLDEVSELPPAIQVALLRVLQSGEFFRLGSVVPRTSTARIITATNKHLADCVKQGTFREDLYYRLNVMRIVVPPLRERHEDIPLLVGHFLKNIGKRTGKDIHSVSPAVYTLLQQYRFPGNVRELENTILFAAVSATSDVIQVRDLPEDIREGRSLVHAEPVATPETYDELRAAQANLERKYLEQLLAASHGNVSVAAKQSGMNRTQLHAMFARHGVIPALYRTKE